MQDIDRLGGRMYGNRLVAHPAHGIGKKRDRGHMIHVRMRDENMIDQRQFLDEQVAYAGARIDQYVMVEQHRCGAQRPTDPSTATEYFQSHCHFVSKVNAPSQFEAGGLARRNAMRPINVL